MYSPFLDKEGNQIEDIDEINIRHIKDLITREVSEGWFLDYKKDFSDKNKSKFSRDVCAFLNTSGGWLIIGMNEDSNGRAKDIIGVEDDGLHDTVQQIIISNISPKPFFEIKIIDSQERKVVVIKTYPGNSTPYIHAQNGVIYVRSGEGKQQIKTSELKLKHELDSLYKKSETKKDKILKEFDLPYEIPDNLSYLKITLLVSPFLSFDFGKDFFSEKFKQNIIDSFKQILHFAGDGSIEIQKIHIINMSWYIEFSYGKGLQQFAQIKRNGVLIIFIPIITSNINKYDVIDGTNLSKFFSKSGENYEINYVDIFYISWIAHVCLEGFKQIYLTAASYKSSIHNIKYSIEIENMDIGTYIFYDSASIIQQIDQYGIIKAIGGYGKRNNIFDESKTLWDKNEDKNMIFGEIFFLFGISDMDSMTLWIKEFIEYIKEFSRKDNEKT